MLVVALKELVAHGSIGCDQKIPWPWYPVHHLVIFRDICVEYSEFPNHFAADIGEERVRNLVSLTNDRSRVHRHTASPEFPERRAISSPLRPTPRASSVMHADHC